MVAHTPHEIGLRASIRCCPTLPPVPPLPEPTAPHLDVDALGQQLVRLLVTHTDLDGVQAAADLDDLTHDLHGAVAPGRAVVVHRDVGTHPGPVVLGELRRRADDVHQGRCGERIGEWLP